MEILGPAIVYEILQKNPCTRLCDAIYMVTMDKVHSATRPAWALHWGERLLSLGLAIGLSAGTTTLLSGWAKRELAPHIVSHEISDGTASFIVDCVVILILTLIGAFIIPVYKKIKTRRYPGTYLYAFQRTDEIKDKFGETRKITTQVVGGLTLRMLENGGVSAEGAAYDWRDGGPSLPTKMRWTSQHVGATEEGDKAVCFIFYDVDRRDAAKRPYQHGLLFFQKQPKEEGVVPPHDTVYRGHIHAVDPPNGTMPFYAYAYAERIGKELSETDIISRLRTYGETLIRRGEEQQ